MFNFISAAQWIFNRIRRRGGQLHIVKLSFVVWICVQMYLLLLSADYGFQYTFATHALPYTASIHFHSAFLSFAVRIYTAVNIANVAHIYRCLSVSVLFYKKFRHTRAQKESRTRAPKSAFYNIFGAQMAHFIATQ